jgi:hypothetical protein
MPVDTIRLVGFGNVEIRSSDGEYIGNLGGAFLDVGAPVEDTNMQNIQLVNRINKMNTAMSDLTSTFQFTMSNIPNALKLIIGIEDNNWRRMHGLKPRRRTMRERRWKPCGKGRRRKRK